MPFTTQREVDKLALPSGKKDVFHFDAACRGLSVRIQGARRSWVVHYAVGGKRRRIDLGDVAGINLKDARTKAAEITGKAKSGVDPLAERAVQAGRERRTFKALIDRYLIQYAERHHGKRMLVESKRGLLVHMAPLHEMEIDKLTRRDLAERFAELVEASGPITANRVRGMISKLFAWAMGQGLAEANPVIGTVRPAPEKTRDRTLSENELELIWRATASDTDYARIVRLLLLTGQRREEVAGMRWSELSADQRTWTIPAERAKNGRAHDVPLSTQAQEILSGVQQRKGREFVFGRGTGGFSGYSKGKRDFDRQLAVLRAETRLARSLEPGEAPDPEDALSPWVIHDLRRTAVTMMAELGVAPHVVEAVVNHVSGHKAGVAGIYNKAVYANEKRAALQRWADHLEHVTKDDLRRTRQ
ncbi:tyrosine-type recombinase/integrase [Geminicoccus harenae]|uniref:tyrosine-type recombinase/integrase n=1 Tax=Geminicoccus harenae TaxID=2498453 RepID=UPI00168B688C|nr:tyrosine-type recombinase/integrase [Geminicoccus harenae]